MKQINNLWKTSAIVLQSFVFLFTLCITSTANADQCHNEVKTVFNKWLAYIKADKTKDIDVVTHQFKNERNKELMAMVASIYNNDYAKASARLGDFDMNLRSISSKDWSKELNNLLVDVKKAHTCLRSKQ